MCVPIAHEVETFTMAAIDFSLFGRPIGNVARSRSSVGATWPSRLFDDDTRRREPRKQLTARLALVPTLLSISSEFPDDFLREDENLA
jgi:hypothetical protein